MGLPRSSYYYRPSSSVQKQREDARIRERLEELALRFPRYGYRRMTAQLQREGVPVNHKRVLRIMRESELLCRGRKRSTRTTDSSHRLRVWPNLYGEAALSGPDQTWVADITYVPVGDRFAYLAVLMDAWSRKVTGWALSRRLDTSLTITALEAALRVRTPPHGCIHHSDRGVQYAARDYIGLLQTHGFRVSMSRRGNPYDNALAESFIKTLKAEEIHLREYRSLAEAGDCIGRFMEEVYNGQRLHSALGYETPERYERTFTHTAGDPSTSPRNCTN